MALMDAYSGPRGSDPPKSGGTSSSGNSARMSVVLQPLTVEDGAMALLKAIKANDAQAVADALRLAYGACMDEWGDGARADGADASDS